MQRKDPLDALPERDLADRERRPRPAAMDADDDALEDLNAFLVAFAHLHVHLDGVAGLHRRPLGQLGLFDDFNRAHVLCPPVSLSLLRPVRPCPTAPAASQACGSTPRACASAGSPRGCRTSARPAPSTFLRPRPRARFPRGACTAGNPAVRARTNLPPPIARRRPRP